MHPLHQIVMVKQMFMQVEQVHILILGVMEQQLLKIQHFAGVIILFQLQMLMDV